MRYSNDLSVLILAACFLAATACSDDGESSAESSPLQPQGGAAGAGAVAGAAGSPGAGAGGSAVAGAGGSAVAGTGGGSANAGAPGAAGVAGAAGAGGSDAEPDENAGAPDAGVAPGGDESPPGEPVAFSDAFAVLQTSCTPCHAMTGTFLPAFAQDGEAAAYAVTQETNGDQFIYQRIIARGVVERSLPPACGSGMLGAAGCLSEEDAALLQAWVDQGALL